MTFLISLGLTLIAAAAILLPVYLILHLSYIKDSRKTVLCFLFSLYLAVVYDMVGMPNATYVRFEINLNVIPFLGFFDGIQSSLLNIALFVPLGVFPPVLWKRYRRAEHTVLFGLGMSLGIELLQMFTYRATDINDLMTNTLGSYLGWLLGMWLVRKSAWLDSLAGEKHREVCRIMGIAFLSMFLIHPFLFSILWNIVMH